MEIKKGDRIPTNWRNWCKDDPTAEVVGFSYNSRTREDAIILRAYEKDHDEYSWVKGTLPQISEKTRQSVLGTGRVWHDKESRGHP